MTNAAVKDYLDAHAQQYDAELFELLRIPSVSTDPKHAADTRRTAEWVADRARKAGVTEVSLIETPLHPVVYGRWETAKDKPTLLIYGHYDVQPVDPLELWESDPFEPTERDGKIYARGSSDMKMNLLGILQGIEALAAVKGELPINLILLLEGEEEIGSPNLPEVVARFANELKSDIIMSGDGGMMGINKPALAIGLKGLAGCQVNLTTSSTDLHSGSYGAAVPNAVRAIAQLAASFHNPDGSVAIEGFYDDVRPLTDEERADIAAVAETGSDEKFMEEAGVTAIVGEAGYTVQELRWTRPTIDFNGIWGGFTGEGAKTVTPAQAHLKITSRLVPNQRPEKILELIAKHIEQHTPAGAAVEIVPGKGLANPFLLSKDAPGMAEAIAVLTAVFGEAPGLVRSGGTVPITDVFTEILGIGPVTIGFGLPGSRAHAPNEWIRPEEVAISRLAYAEYFATLGG
ncbi:MAG: dipeptidase [Thermomicrobiales bacterium]|nr:MAG: dipeptidase [Thermomicrobiales bacterium]